MKKKDVYDIIREWTFVKELGDQIKPVGENAWCFGENLKPAGRTSEEIRKHIIDRQFRQLSKIFKFDERTRNDFRDAVSGSGNEWNEINYLKSSTLLAFLTFARVNQGCRITIRLNGRDIVFTHVKFEMKNPLGGRGGQSNMDIVLWNDEGDILYLESKFSEYLTTDESYKQIPSKRYRHEFARVFNHWDEFSMSDNYDYTDKEGKIHEGFDLNSKYGKHYIEGLKQMVAHYMGIRKNKNSREKMPDGRRFKNIYLAEILYKFSDKDRAALKGKDVDPFDDYEALHGELVKRLDEPQSGITVIDKVLTYQDVFKNNQRLLTAEVKSFYSL